MRTTSRTRSRRRERGEDRARHRRHQRRRPRPRAACPKRCSERWFGWGSSERTRGEPSSKRASARWSRCSSRCFARRSPFSHRETVRAHPTSNGVCTDCPWWSLSAAAPWARMRTKERSSSVPRTGRTQRRVIGMLVKRFGDARLDEVRDPRNPYISCSAPRARWRCRDKRLAGSEVLRLGRTLYFGRAARDGGRKQEPARGRAAD